jgi:hypothetical protein
MRLARELEQPVERERWGFVHGGIFGQILIIKVAERSW